MTCALYRPPARGSTFFSMESIEFQPASEKQGIIAMFQAVMAEMKTQPKGYKGGLATKAIEDWLLDRTGIRIHFITDEALAACLPLYSSDAHVLSMPFWHGQKIDEMQSKWKRASDGKRGWVDLQKSKLGGIYSDYDHPMYMNFDVLVALGLPVEQIAAIFMHEIGHTFTFCEYADRLSTANQVLEQIAKEVNGKNAKRAEHIFKLASDVHKEVNPKDIDLLLSEDRVVSGTAYQSLVYGALSSVLRDARYSETSAEQLADSFATRWGFGRELIMGLDRISSKMGDPAKSTASMWIISLIQVAIAAALGFMTYALTTVPIAAVAMFVLQLLLNDGNLTYRTYDNLRDRYKRVRNEIVMSLKREDLPKDQVKTALVALDDIDRVMEDTGTGETLITRFLAVVSPWSRRTVNDREHQRLLEDLASSDLFVMSQRFKHA